MDDNLHLGLDSGSVSLEACLVDGAGRLRAASVVVVTGDTLAALRRALEELAASCGGETPAASVCATGSGRDLVARLLSCARVNEITAHATGTGRLLPDGAPATIVEIGGQDSKLIQVRREEDGVRVLDHAMNTLCAAGTGAFFDGLAGHLGLTTEQLARTAAGAGAPVHVAGRCAVFARSDLVHLCQKGLSLEEIALGICFAAARNVAGNLVRGRRLHDTVFFTGGVAANEGMVRALREVLGLAPGMPVVPEHYRVLGAVGAAIHGARRAMPAPTTLGDILDGLDHEPATRKPQAPSSTSTTTSTSTFARAAPVVPGRRSGGQLAIGLDVGSTSIKWAVTDEAGGILDSWYDFTKGSPAAALGDALGRLSSSAPLREASRGARVPLCITGSGRKLAAALTGCACTVNEVAAMTRAARLLDPEADTIFEIGGQDAKFVRIEAGRTADFVLNIACSAGTGALLVEEARRLGVGVEELDRMALAAACPVQLHNRCSVFMDSDLVFQMQSGAPRGDIAAGLVRAVALNYLDRVVGRRSAGERIVFLGGVARLASVARALAELTGQAIAAHPWGHLAGAIGAAARAREEASAGGAPAVDVTRLAVPPLSGKPSQRHCGGCGADCTITRIEVEGEREDARRVLFTGDGCGRYDALNRGGPAADAGPPAGGDDLFDERLRRAGIPAAGGESARGRIGVPRAHQSIEIAPFIRTFLDRLGLPWAFSGRSTPATIQRGEQLAPAQHCIPVKTAIAHCERLLDDGASALFLPRVRHVTLFGRELLSCVYSQQLASFASLSVGKLARERGARIVAPLVDLSPGQGPAQLLELSRSMEAFGKTPREVRRAFMEAVEAYRAFKRDFSTAGAAMMDDASRGRPLLVLFGRPYSLYDPALNLQAARRLRRCGARVVPYDAVTGLEEPGGETRDIPWLAGDEQVRAALAVARRPHVFPVVITYYGCGVDAFLAKHVARVAGREKPLLLLELDGHGAEAGLETRLEAFMDQAASWAPRTPARRTSYAPPPEGVRRDFRFGALRGRVVAMPHFAPHAHSFAGALERLGLDVELLPPPDESVRALGERHSSGRECNPYFFILGDLVKWAADDRLPADRKSYFIFSTTGSCLLSQYGSAFDATLREAGLGGVRIWTPTGRQMIAELPLEALRGLGTGLLGIDYLVRWASLLRPYEKRAGEVDAVLAWCLGAVRAGVRAGRAAGAVAQAAGMMRELGVEVPGEEGRRPRVGIIGDIYTRINPFANQGLWETLEEMGCEVLAPPFFVDILLYDMVMDPVKLCRELEVGRGAKRAALSAFQWWVWNGVRRIFPGRPEIHGDGASPVGPGLEWRREASRYLNVETEGLLAQNVGKAVDHLRAGADGIVNVMCHGCMVGISTEAAMRGLSEDRGGVPVLNLSYDSLGDVHARTRIEAFVELAKARRERRTKS